jgi:hypothetical protein
MQTDDNADLQKAKFSMHERRETGSNVTDEREGQYQKQCAQSRRTDEGM